MTKLLEQAIAKARELSEAEQNAIAGVARIRDDLRSGRTRPATDEEVAAVWEKCGATRSN
jgi:hypothetical protein